MYPITVPALYKYRKETNDNTDMKDLRIKLNCMIQSVDRKNVSNVINGKQYKFGSHLIIVNNNEYITEVKKVRSHKASRSERRRVLRLYKQYGIVNKAV